MTIISLFKSGNSSAVRLNKEILEQAGMTENEPVTLSVEGHKIIIEKVELPKPDANLLNSILLSLKKYYAGINGSYTSESAADLITDTIHDFPEMKCYIVPLYYKDKIYQKIVVPVDYLNDFERMLSFLFDYFLLSDQNNGLINVRITKREDMYDKWWKDTHEEFYSDWDVSPSIYHDYMKEGVLKDEK